MDDADDVRMLIGFQPKFQLQKIPKLHFWAIQGVVLVCLSAQRRCRRCRRSRSSTGFEAIEAMAWESRELVPDGVNVGGWFCLEDWFYSQARGDKVGHFVATPNLDYEQKTFQLNHDNLVGHVGTIFSITKSEDWVISHQDHQVDPQNPMNAMKQKPFVVPLLSDRLERFMKSSMQCHQHCMIL